MGARTRRFTSLASGSGKATAVVVCAVMLLAGCGGSGGSATEASTPVIRGDAPATSSLTVYGTPATAAVGTPIALTSADGTGTDPVSYTTTSTDCAVTGTSLTATAAGTCAVTATKGTQTGTATFTFTAVTVTFNSYGGYGTMGPQTAGGSTPLIANTFQKDNHRFYGWSTSPGGQMIYPNGTTYPFKTSATLYAIWVTNPSPLTVAGTPATAAVGTTIALTSSGGSAGAVTYSTTSNGCTVSSKSLTATAVGTCVVTATLRTETATATFTFTAATVTFNANGGEKTMVSQAATRLTALKANEFTKSGYVFDGWATTSTGDKAYGNGDDYKFDKSVTLYARWVVAPSSTVTFNANGGTETMENQTANMSTPLKENVFKRSGYVFDGWSTTVNGDKAYGNGDNYTFGESATLYARWAAVPSTVVTQAATVPGAPALTALSRRSKTEVWVTFSAPSSTGGAPITGYTVTATRNGVDVTQSFPAEAGRVSVGPLTRYAVYTFTVRAVNSVGTSEPSKASRFTVG